MINAANTEIFDERILNVIEWKRFETLCCELINTATKYEARETSYGADGGIDIRVYEKDSNNIKSIVQCKAWNTYTVGVKHIRELLGVMAKEKVNSGIFITTSKYTKEAENFAKETNITLVSGAKLASVLNGLPEEKLKKLIETTLEGDYSTPTCPKCGVKMKLRETDRPFWGCAKYPKCRHKFFIQKAEIIE